MIITQHPSDATLAAFAAGGLDEGRELVVGAHISLCSHCRKAVAGFEAVAGALIDDLPGAPLAASSRARVMSLIGSATRAPSVRPAASAFDLLKPYGDSDWRWMGVGVSWRPILMPTSPDATRVFMLKAAPGTKLPQHTHTGIEWTCVLEGAFRHDLGLYGPGDFDEADDTIDHRPVVEDGVPCICLVAMQGQLQLQGLLGRLLQPLVRI